MGSLVRASLATVLVLPALSCAQEGRPAQRPAQRQVAAAAGQARRLSQDQPEEDQTPRRLETVTWNSVKHELTWVISRGDKRGASYKALGSDSYLINMDDATMSFNTEKRRFSKEEAANVHVLMDVIAKYAIDSTVWWDDGQGEPLDNNGNPKQDKKPPKERRNPERDNVAILHVAALAPQAISPADVDRQIQKLEDRLAELRRLRMKLGAAHLARD
jgi:hypothetical protein